MTTPALSAAIASPAPDRGRAPTGARQADDGPSFDSVLSGRPVTKQQDGSMASSGPGKKSTAPADPKHDDGKDAGGDAAKTEAASNLPQLALYIAAQANPAASSILPSGSAKTQSDAPGERTSLKPAPITPAEDGKPPGQRNVVASSSVVQLDTTKSNVASTALAATATAPSAAGEKPSTTMETSHSAPPHKQNAQRPTASNTAAIAVTPDNQPSASPDASSGKIGHDPMTLPARVATVEAASGKHPDRASASPSGADATILPAAFTPVSAQGASAAGQTPQPGIAVPVQNPQWAGEFGRQFLSLTQSGRATGSHTAQLRLDPPNLGPLHISININDNIAHAVFFSPHAAVRQAVENALPQLQQQLAQAGISLGQASVNDQGASNHTPGESSGKRRSTSTAAVAGTATSASATMPPPVARNPIPNAIVDTFA